jgi:dTMP kinase
LAQSHGLLVVLEGLDGAGTTTQAQLLDRHLSDRGLSTSLTREPTGEPVGRLISDALLGKLVSAESPGKVNLSEEALCLLFS